jgi:hypothetical protein
MTISKWKTFLEKGVTDFPKILKQGMIFKINPDTDKSNWSDFVRERAMEDINKLYTITDSIETANRCMLNDNWTCSLDFIEEHFIYVGMSK